MANAARNLTPVTLELGAKALAIVAPDFSIKAAAERIMWVKMLNAGQICTDVDYLFLPKGAEIEFSDHCRRLFARRFPDINGPDYTSIIDGRSFARLQGALEDARAKGATLVSLAEGQQPDAKSSATNTAKGAPTAQPTTPASPRPSRSKARSLV